jgi:hypothetical protein
MLLDLRRRTTLLHDMGTAVADFTFRNILLLRKLRTIFPLTHALLALTSLAHTLNRRIITPIIAAQRPSRAHLLAKNSFQLLLRLLHEVLSAEPSFDTLQVVQGETACGTRVGGELNAGAGEQGIWVQVCF